MIREWMFNGAIRPAVSSAGDGAGGPRSQHPILSSWCTAAQRSEWRAAPRTTMGSTVSADRRGQGRGPCRKSRTAAAMGDGTENDADSRVGKMPRRPAEPERALLAVERRVQLEQLPPELLLRVLSYLDVPSLCATSLALGVVFPALIGVLTDASLWGRASLTLCAQPWPAHPPTALRGLRVCSYRWPSAAHARDQLDWLGSGLDSSRILGVQRLELVGRNLDRDTVRACVRLCVGLRVLSLHDVRVQDSWMRDLATLKHLEALHLDWHTEMSVQQMLRLASSCPSLRLIDSGGCPQDCTAGRNRAAAKDALHLVNTDLVVA